MTKATFTERQRLTLRVYLNTVQTDYEAGLVLDRVWQKLDLSAVKGGISKLGNEDAEYTGPDLSVELETDETEKLVQWCKGTATGYMGQILRSILRALML